MWLIGCQLGMELLGSVHNMTGKGVVKKEEIDVLEGAFRVKDEQIKKKTTIGE
jgi:hypothetical protein